MRRAPAGARDLAFVLVIPSPCAVSARPLGYAGMKPKNVDSTGDDLPDK